MVKAIVSCIEGLEEVTQLELKEILNVKSEIAIPSRVLFEAKKEEDLAKFVVFSRSIIKGYLLFDNFIFKDLDEILNKTKSIEFAHLNGTFVVRCDRSGIHDFGSQDIERSIGGIITDRYKIKANLENPDATIFIDIIENNCFIGLDFCGEKLSKRNYRVRTIPNPVNPCLAYSLVRIADFLGSDIALDPFCKSGEIAIEAVLFSLDIPNCEKYKDTLLFSKFLDIDFKFKTKDKKLNITAADSFQNNVRASEMNAKIAGVNKNIRFSRMDIEWLDTKFEENNIDKIITVPPVPTSIFPIKDAEKMYKEFFYNTSFILKKKGTIVLATPVPELFEKYAIEYKLKKTRSMDIKYQNSSYKILIFSK